MRRRREVSGSCDIRCSSEWTSTRGWWNLKLNAAAPPGKLVGVVVGKANYWLGWHIVEQRFAVRVDYSALKRKRPELLEAVFTHLQSPIGELIGELEMRDGFVPRGLPAPRETLCIYQGFPGGGPRGTRELGNSQHTGDSLKTPIHDPDEDLL